MRIRAVQAAEISAAAGIRARDEEAHVGRRLRERNADAER
jgi:hypothetical protein